MNGTGLTALRPNRPPQGMAPQGIAQNAPPTRQGPLQGIAQVPPPPPSAMPQGMQEMAAMELVNNDIEGLELDPKTEALLKLGEAKELVKSANETLAPPAGNLVEQYQQQVPQGIAAVMAKLGGQPMPPQPPGMSPQGMPPRPMPPQGMPPGMPSQQGGASIDPRMRAFYEAIGGNAPSGPRQGPPRPMPPQGLGGQPAPNMGMPRAAQGGIVGYEDGGDVEEKDPMQSQIQADAERYQALQKALTTATTAEDRQQVQALLDELIAKMTRDNTHALVMQEIDKRKQGGGMKGGGVVSLDSGGSLDDILRRIEERSESGGEAQLNEATDADYELLRTTSRDVLGRDMATETAKARDAAEKYFLPTDEERELRDANVAAEQAYFDARLDPEERRLAEKEMLFDILTTPGGVTNMARRSGEVRPAFREQERGLKRAQVQSPNEMALTGLEADRTAMGQVYERGENRYERLSTEFNQAQQTLGTLYSGTLNREQTERLDQRNADLTMLNAALETEISRVERGERRTLELAQLRVDLETTITNLENDSLDRVADMIDEYQATSALSQHPPEERAIRITQIEATEAKVLLRLVTNLRSQIAIIDGLEETMVGGGGGNNESASELPIIPDGPEGDAIYNALPSGSEYVNADGTKSRKP